MECSLLQQRKKQTWGHVSYISPKLHILIIHGIFWVINNWFSLLFSICFFSKLKPIRYLPFCLLIFTRYVPYLQLMLDCLGNALRASQKFSLSNTQIVYSSENLSLSDRFLLSHKREMIVYIILEESKILTQFHFRELQRSSLVNGYNHFRHSNCY